MTTVHTLAEGAAVEDHGYRPAPKGLRANMIFSADGAAGFAGRAGPLSSPADHTLLVALRAYADVVLVGAGTARAENYGPVRLRAEHLAQRRELGMGDEPPTLAVVARSGRLPDSMFGSVPPILVTSARGRQSPQPGTEKSCEVMVCGDEQVDIAEAVRRLRERGRQRILCEGGPTLLNELVEADLVDELCVTLAPRLAGSQPLGAARQADLTAPTGLRLGHVLVGADDYLYLRYVRP